MKRIGLNIRIAFHSLSNFKLRTALAMLGVFLGTFSLIVVSNLSDSLSKKTEAEVENVQVDTELKKREAEALKRTDAQDFGVEWEKKLRELGEEGGDGRQTQESP